MTTRRLNFTDAVRIGQSDVQVVTDASGDALSFDVAYSLARYSLPETAEVVVEAYVGWNVMRFHFGTVGVRRSPSSLALSAFEHPEGLRFRLKVLGTGENQGKILAECDRIHPTDAGGREDAKSFVAVRPSDLGNVVWRLVFEPAQPVLQINERLGDWQSFLRRPTVRSLLLPEIVRQVVLAALEDQADDEDENAWQHHALALATQASGPPPRTDDSDEIERWADDVTRGFALRHRLWRGVSELISDEVVE